MTSEKLSLVGHWDKNGISACSAIYPEHLEFRENGMFYGRNRVDQPMRVWDVGRYRIESEEKIRMTLANDSSEVYLFSISGNDLVFVDERECRFTYRRVSEEYAPLPSS